MVGDRTLRLVPALLIGILLAAGCTPTTPTPSTPVPTFSCTPEAGGAEFDCSQHQYDEMVAKDALYAEAEAVYRKFLAEDTRVFRAGGLLRPTQALLETTAGDFLEDSMKLYRSLKDEGRSLVGGEIRLVSLSRAPAAKKGSSIVALTACVDARTADVVTRGKSVGKGFVVEDLLYFGRVEGAMKILGADGKGDSQCAGI